MFDVLNSISVHVLQLPTDKNGRIAIVSASIVMPDGRIVSDVCSASPRTPFENEDTLEIAKNRVINVVKQKAESYIQNHQNISQNASQDDKNRFRGGGGKPASRNQLSLIRNKAQEQRKNSEELAETSLLMFLEKGLDPVQGVFDLHIPDSSALLEPSEKTKLGRTRGVFSGHGRTPKSMAFSLVAAISPNRWHTRLTCPEAASGHTA